MLKLTKKTKKDALTEWLCNHRYELILITVIAFGVYLNLAFFYGPSWINGSDNYLYTSFAYSLVNGHSVACNIVDCVSYTVIAGTAIFFALFGYSIFVSSFFGIFCYVLTIIVIYLIGKRVYSKKAGLISGFLYSIFPLVLSQSSNVGDDIPMVLLISLSVYLI